MNNMLLTTPITVQNITRIKVVDVVMSEDRSSMIVELALSGAAGIIWTPNPYRLLITNGDCDGLAAPAMGVPVVPAPTMQESIIAVKLTGAGVATAFTTCRTAYFSAGDHRGQLLTAMQGISGLVVGGLLDGQTRPILPPGAVT